MKALLRRHFRTSLLLGALAVALIATVVSGREKGIAEPVASSERAAAQLAAQGAAPVAAGDLDLERLHRTSRDAPVADLFVSADPQAAVHASGAEKGEGPAAAPPEPPLPFKYLGKVIDDGKLSVFLTSGPTHYSVQAGQTLDKQYRVDKVTEAAVTFTYLPTGSRKTLAIPGVNQ